MTSPHPSNTSLLPAPVLIVEDEQLIQRRLTSILLQLGYSSDLLYFTATLAAARQLTSSLLPALALVDLGLPDGNGAELIAELRESDPAMAILVISAWSTEDVIMAAIKAGASGYLLKERDDFEVSLAIRSVLRGGAPIDPFIARRIIAELNPASAHESQPSSTVDQLSTREKGILQLVATGLSNREIAEQLNISRHTVESHVKHIYRKLAVSSRVRAISAARSIGLLD